MEGNLCVQSLPFLVLRRTSPFASEGQGTIAVVFDFVQPLVAGRRCVDKRREEHAGIISHQVADGCADLAPFRGAGRVHGDLVHRAVSCYAGSLLLEELSGPVAGSSVVVLFLDEQPVFSLSIAVHADQVPAALQTLPVQIESEMPFFQARLRIGLGLPRAPIPQHDRAPAILTLGNRPFKRAVRQRMVFSADRQSLVSGIQAGPFGYRPAQQNTVEFQPEIVVEPCRIVLLNEVGKTLPVDRRLRARLRRLFEIALPFVFFESHKPIGERPRLRLALLKITSGLVIPAKAGIHLSPDHNGSPPLRGRR